MELSGIHVSYEEPENWGIAFAIDDVPFEVSLDKKTTLLQRFYHEWYAFEETCPLCGQSAYQQCPALWEKPQLVKELLIQVINHPSIRLKLLTETNLNFDNPTLGVWLANHGYQPLDVVLERLTFFQEEADRLGVELLGLSSTLSYAMVNVFKQNQSQVQLLLPHGKTIYCDLKETEQSVVFLDESQFYPFVPIANKNVWKTIERLRTIRK